MSNYLATIEKLPIGVLQDFNKTGKSAAIPKAVQEFILELNAACRIKKFESNISLAATQLLKEFPGMAFNTARQRIYDALNYFHLNNTVKNEAWDHFYADKLENLAKVAIANDNITEARRCFQSAHNYRTNRDESAFDRSLLRPKPQIVSCEVTHERLGITKHNKKELAADSWSFVNKIPINQAQKDRIKNEIIEVLGIEDVEFEEIINGSK